MGCKGSKAVQTDGDQPDGYKADTANIDVVDGVVPMTASDTRDYLRTKSQTKEGQHKARVMVQIDFHTLLKELHASQQGSIKQNLNDEIKLKAVQDAVRGVYEDLMDTMEGRNKTAVNNEVKSKANAQDDIDLIKGLKASLVGVLKSKVTEEVLAQDQSDAIRRQISSDMADTVDKLQTAEMDEDAADFKSS